MKKLIVLSIIVALVLSIGLFGCGTVQELQEPEQVMSLELGSVVYLSGGAGALASATLTASIEPSSATNKQVEWFVEWQNPDSLFATGKSVYDYVDVVPASFGSLNATIYCYQAFSTEVIVIRVVTLDGGRSATCNVLFQGAPTQLDIEKTGLVYKPIETGYNGAYYEIGSNSTISLNLSLNNAFGEVGSTYGNYSVAVQGFGSFNICDYYRISQWFTVNIRPITTQEANNSYNFINAQIIGGVLQITTQSAIDTFPGIHKASAEAKAYWNNTNIAYGYADKYYGESGGHVKPHFSITVTETVSGITSTFYLKIVPSVDLVSLNKTTIVF